MWFTRINRTRISVIPFAFLLLIVTPCSPGASSISDNEWRRELELEPPPILEPSELAGLPPLFSSMPRLLEATSERPDISRAEMGEVHGDMGRLYHAHGLPRAAETFYRNARRLAPDDHRWPYYMALIQQKEGRLVDALASWVNAMAIRSSSATLVHMAEVLVAMDRLEEAAAVLSNARRIDPSSSSAAALLGGISLSLKRYRGAVEHFEAALADAPDANRLHDHLARAHRGLGAEEEAKKHEALGGDVEAPLYDPLFSALERLREEEARGLLAGRLAERAGKIAEAIAAYRAVLEGNPDSGVAMSRLGGVLELSGDRTAAVLVYRRALALAPSYEPHYRLGVILVEEGSLASGVDHLKKAIALDSERAAPNLALARAMVENGQIEASLPFFTAVARHSPTDQRAWLGGAGALMKLGRFGQAEKVLVQARSALPENAAVTAALARLLAASPDTSVRDGKRALALALRAHEADPSASHAETLAMALAQLGRCKEAAAWQRRALEAVALTGDKKTARRIENTLRVYESNQPCKPPPLHLE